MMLQVLLMKVAHGLPLPVEALPCYLSERERLFQAIVAELRPLVASGWIALMSVVWEHWLHPLYTIREVHNGPVNRAARSSDAADSEGTCGEYAHVYHHRSCMS